MVNLPDNALVLDEDVKKHPHLQDLRNKKLRFKGGRGSFNPQKRVSVISADNIFASTDDKPLLNWCNSHRYQLITCNIQDFQQLDQKPNILHSGILICINQPFTHNNPQIIANKVKAAYDHNRLRDFKNSVFVIKP